MLRNQKLAWTHNIEPQSWHKKFATFGNSHCIHPSQKEHLCTTF
jgi:hypothetical protein